MNRLTHRRLAGLEKQVAAEPAASQYPPLPSRAEQKLMTFQELYEVYQRMLRGEYSRRPEDEPPRMDLEGMTREELAEFYAQSIQVDLEGWSRDEQEKYYAQLRREVQDKVRREFDSRAAAAQADGEAD
jgi:hypothetical protein